MTDNLDLRSPARMEARVALSRLFDRFADLEATARPSWGGGVLGRTVSGVEVAV